MTIKRQKENRRRKKYMDILNNELHLEVYLEFHFDSW